MAEAGARAQAGSAGVAPRAVPKKAAAIHVVQAVVRTTAGSVAIAAAAIVAEAGVVRVATGLVRPATGVVANHHPLSASATDAHPGGVVLPRVPSLEGA
jgi:hypothetical protein